MKIKVLNMEGKSTKNLDLSDKIFSLKVNEALVQTVINYQIQRLKPRTAKTKQRNQIIGSTAKIYAQKGTGGARHSSRKAPIFVGGGVAHGPKGAVYSKMKVNKKIKKIGLSQVLSEKNKVNSLYVVEDFKTEIKKTKVFYNFLKKNNLQNTLFIADEGSKNKILKSVRNIPNVKLIDQTGTTVYDLLKYKNVLFTTSSIKNLEERLTK